MEYNFRDIEKKWQKQWVDHKTYQVKEDESKQKFYVLNMFPYPSLGSHEFAVAFHKNSFFCGRTEASAPTRLPEVRGNCERYRQNVFDVTKENSL